MRYIAIGSFLSLVMVAAPAALAQQTPFPGLNPFTGLDRTAPPVLVGIIPSVAAGQQRIFLNGLNFTWGNTVVFSGPSIATAGASSAVGNSAVAFVPAHLPPGTYTVTLVDAYGRPSNPVPLQIGSSFSPTTFFTPPTFGTPPPATSGNQFPQQPVRSAFFPTQNQFPTQQRFGFPQPGSYPPWVYGIMR